MPRYIDAYSLKKEVHQFSCWVTRWNEHHDIATDVIREMKKSIEELIDEEQTADVQEVKHGHWIEINSDMGIYRCSQCRETVGGQTGSRFCPNCGAKMDEEEKK